MKKLGRRLGGEEKVLFGLGANVYVYHFVDIPLLLNFLLFGTHC